MRTQIKQMHGRTMKSSKTNFVTTSQNRSKFGAAEMKAHNAAFASAKRTQHAKMNKMLEDRIQVQKEAITGLVTPQVYTIFDNDTSE